MYLSAVLRDSRFQGNGRISPATAALAGGSSPDGTLSVINAVDVRASSRVLCSNRVARVILWSDFAAADYRGCWWRVS
jgi:hypothetical protein